MFVSEGVDLGADVFIDATAPVYLGAGVRVGPGARILTSVDRAGDAVVTTGDDPAKPVLIGAGAQIGARAVIPPGVTIGERTVIRDDSEVRENCRPDATYGAFRRGAWTTSDLGSIGRPASSKPEECPQYLRDC
ncbi:acyltransferase [Gordonia terrae]